MKLKKDIRLRGYDKNNVNKNNNISQEQLEAFERYISNAMGATERLEFDTRLNEDAAFRTQFQETKVMLLGIESAALKEQMSDFHTEMDGVISMKPNTSKKNNSRFMIFSIAASIAVLMGIFWMFGGGSSTDKMFAKHFTPDPGLPTVMSTTDEYEFYEAMVDYKQEKYVQAISKWEQLLPQKPANDTLNYFLGVAELANNNETKAEVYLNKAALASQSVFINETYFYLGLAQLKSDNIDAAKISFNKSSLEESKTILAELKK